MDEILRKYIRYALNEKPFNPDLIADLIQLRKASGLDDSQVTEVLNEISRRIVRDKGTLFYVALATSRVDDFVCTAFHFLPMRPLVYIS